MQIRAVLRAKSRALRLPKKRSDKITSKYIRDHKQPRRSGKTAMFSTANARALTLPSNSASSGL